MLLECLLPSKVTISGFKYYLGLWTIVLMGK